ncbi:hypothetical protein CCP1ISM_60009 [Azospirillaceae bacterium]
MFLLSFLLTKRFKYYHIYNRHMNDKKKRILKEVTNEWTSTRQIAKKLNTGGQNIIEALYELFVDDKKISRKLMPFSNKDGEGNIAYWRLK